MSQHNAMRDMLYTLDIDSQIWKELNNLFEEWIVNKPARDGIYLIFVEIYNGHKYNPETLDPYFGTKRPSNPPPPSPPPSPSPPPAFNQHKKNVYTFLF
jgi:hypothetical protein